MDRFNITGDGPNGRDGLTDSDMAVVLACFFVFLIVVGLVAYFTS